MRAFRIAPATCAATASIFVASLSISSRPRLLRMNPLALELAQGRIAGAASINARETIPVSTIDVRLSNARIESAVAWRGDPPLAGSLLGRARLVGRGRSVREAAAHANGTVALVTPSGEVRESLAELTGINVVRGLGLLLAHDQRKSTFAVAWRISMCATAWRIRANLTIDTRTMLDPRRRRCESARRTRTCGCKGTEKRAADPSRRADHAARTLAQPERRRRCRTCGRSRRTSGALCFGAVAACCRAAIRRCRSGRMTQLPRAAGAERTSSSGSPHGARLVISARWEACPRSAFPEHRHHRHHPCHDHTDHNADHDARRR